jgi:hypothetical protein
VSTDLHKNSLKAQTSLTLNIFLNPRKSKKAKLKHPTHKKPTKTPPKRQGDSFYLQNHDVASLAKRKAQKVQTHSMLFQCQFLLLLFKFIFFDPNLVWFFS